MSITLKGDNKLKIPQLLTPKWLFTRSLAEAINPVCDTHFLNFSPSEIQGFQPISLVFKSNHSALKPSFKNNRFNHNIHLQVLTPARAPSHWVPMDISSTECKLMEVRKYSAEYQEIDCKFRKPHLVIFCKNLFTVQE